MVTTKASYRRIRAGQKGLSNTARLYPTRRSLALGVLVGRGCSMAALRPSKLSADLAQVRYGAARLNMAL
jgi:hypothetical protein